MQNFSKIHIGYVIYILISNAYVKNVIPIVGIRQCQQSIIISDLWKNIPYFRKLKFQGKKLNPHQ